MTFRDRLIATLRVLQPILDEPGVLVVGSEVPNLLEPGAASTLVVSQDVDIGVPVGSLPSVKRHLRDTAALRASADEPSVYVPAAPDLIEANFLGLDPTISSASDTYVLDDAELPLMVFGPLGLLRPGPVVSIDDVRVPLPRPAGLMLEKLLTDRTGEKGARDLLVVAGLLVVTSQADLDEFVTLVRGLGAEDRHAVVSALTVLSLMEGRPAMPDPGSARRTIAELLARVDATT